MVKLPLPFLLCLIETEAPRASDKSFSLSTMFTLTLLFESPQSLFESQQSFFESHSPQLLIKAKKTKIKHISQLLNVLSPKRLLKRGFALITDVKGNYIYSVEALKKKDKLFGEAGFV